MANVHTRFHQPGWIWYNLWVNLSQQYFFSFYLSAQHRGRSSSKHQSSSPKAKEAGKTTRSSNPILLTHPPAQPGIPSLWGPGTCTGPWQQRSRKPPHPTESLQPTRWAIHNSWDAEKAMKGETQCHPTPSDGRKTKAAELLSGSSLVSTVHT